MRASRVTDDGRSVDGRTAILLAAVDVFATYGYEGATPSAIARAAAVTQPLVYYHFGSKERLWEETIELIFKGMASAFDEIQRDLRDADSLTLLKGLYRRYVRFVGENPSACRLMHNIGSRQSDRLDLLFEQYVRPQHEILCEVIRRAQRDGRVKAHPAEEVLVVLIGAAVNVFSRAGLYSRQLGRDVTAAAFIDFHADTVVELLFDGLAVEEQPVPAAQPTL